MLRRWICRQQLHQPPSCRPSASIRVIQAHRNYTASLVCRAHNNDAARTRNIGIIAHIDAGKTTTTERMLYYSGYTRRLGDVDEGSTVTDFLPAERARGITIQSAAISFSWPPASPGDAIDPPLNLPRSDVPHSINLIDTPGHADFTFEVLRSLRVLDGAVCILDGVAGVEAQTEKVWTQSLNYQIPRIVFVNKLDRDGAAFAKTVREIGAHLDVWPAVCAIPWWTADGRLCGVGDVVGLRGFHYPEGGDGKEIDAFNLQQLDSDDTALAAELRRARVALVELLSEHDHVMVERFLEADEDHLAIPPTEITESLRRCTLMQPQVVAPVFAGASFRNIGVQPLLDAVVNILPGPNERPESDISLGADARLGLASFLSGKAGHEALASTPAAKKHLSKNKASFALQKIEACALAFKVVADPKRGILVYVRVYSGAVNRNTALWNTNLQVSERVQRLMRMYANDALDIETIEAGQIGVIPALKYTRTGDTLVSYTGANPKTGPPAPINQLQLKPIVVPPPVFFVSVEADRLSEEKHIQESLDLLLREDPSLHVSVDGESGQTHLSGMGELHLEIARDRLVQDLRAKARIGRIEIGYREAILTAVDHVTETFDREVGGKSSKATCTASISPRSEANPDLAKEAHIFELADNNRLTVSTPTLDADGKSADPEQPGLPEHLPLTAVRQALQNGVSAALARGPVHNYPLHATNVHITFDPATHLFPNTTTSALSSAARSAVQKAQRQSSQISSTVLMEPVMHVAITVDEDSLGPVVHDLSSARGGSVVSLGAGDEETDQRVGLSSTEMDRIYAPPDPFAGSQTHVESSAATSTRQIIARVPLKEMVGYLKHLRSLTGGKGTFTMTIDRFEKMSAQRQKMVLSELRGEHE